MGGNSWSDEGKGGFMNPVTIEDKLAVNKYDVDKDVQALTITGDVIWADQTVYLDEPLYIEGNLTLDNVTIICNAVTNGSVFIQVNNSGNLYVYNDSLFTWNNTGHYQILVYGHITMEDSTVEYAGYNSPGPLEENRGLGLMGNSSIVKNSIFKNNYYPIFI